MLEQRGMVVGMTGPAGGGERLKHESSVEQWILRERPERWWPELQ